MADTTRLYGWTGDTRRANTQDKGRAALLAEMQSKRAPDFPLAFPIPARLGHKDGGILAGKVYGHLLTKHRHQPAKRLQFGIVAMP